jgi:hypothetical protein
MVLQNATIFSNMSDSFQTEMVACWMGPDAAV